MISRIMIAATMPTTVGEADPGRLSLLDRLAAELDLKRLRNLADARW